MMNHYTNNYNSGNGNQYQQRQDRGGAYSSVAPPAYQAREYRVCLQIYLIYDNERKDFYHP